MDVLRLVGTGVARRALLQTHLDGVAHNLAAKEAGGSGTLQIAGAGVLLRKACAAVAQIGAITSQLDALLV
ncbi:MAG: hypothetical protein DMF70_02870 [Acidobacteria bacterium]|nr:MAG: hypothetical protein DMF70_02870 [Acidobacteriota bacterium]